jgi:hypothetical protein
MTLYDDFDTGVEGPGFPDALAAVSVDTTHGATLSSNWDTKVGATCLGSLHFAAQFTEYVAGAPDERVYGSLDFTPSDWSGAASLHMMVKLSPADAPLSEVRMFVMSGDGFLFRSTADTSTFKSGAWNEMVLSLAPGSTYDATKARRVGVQLTLSRAGTAGIPTDPPTIRFWIDDIWVEPS